MPALRGSRHDRGAGGAGRDRHASTRADRRRSDRRLPLPAPGRAPAADDRGRADPPPADRPRRRSTSSPSSSAIADAAAFAADAGRGICAGRRALRRAVRGGAEPSPAPATWSSPAPRTTPRRWRRCAAWASPIAGAGRRRWCAAGITAASARTRSARARELLTELDAGTAARARRRPPTRMRRFARFDQFLSQLPAGVQLFSLFHANPELLQLVAEIMGEAPRLAEQLARRPLLLDGVLSGEFFAPLPRRRRRRSPATSPVARPARATSRTRSTCRAAGPTTASSRSACSCCGAASTAATPAPHLPTSPIPRSPRCCRAVEADFARAARPGPGGASWRSAPGQARQPRDDASSDLDLIFIYDAPEDAEASDGARPLGRLRPITRGWASA